MRRAVPVTRASTPRSSAEDTNKPTGASSTPAGPVDEMLRSCCGCDGTSPRLEFDLTGKMLGMQWEAGSVDLDRGFKALRFDGVISGLPAKGSEKYGEHL